MSGERMRLSLAAAALRMRRMKGRLPTTALRIASS